jgi:hypothetical protein
LLAAAATRAVGPRHLANRKGAKRRTSARVGGLLDGSGERAAEGLGSGRGGRDGLKGGGALGLQRPRVGPQPAVVESGWGLCDCT